MPLYLSASSIADFLSCPERFHYRTTQKEQATATEDMLVGTITHYVIEKYWTSRDKAEQETKDQLAFYKISPAKQDKALTSVNIFFDVFSSLLSESDLIEYTFKLPLMKDVFLVGKMDRISSNNIFDWKTTQNPPKNISNDVQFILYHEAYKRLFGTNPVAVYYASLTTGKLIKFTPNESLTKILFSDIIPSMISVIKSNNFYRQGLFTGACKGCSFKDICYEESNYVMDSTTFDKK